MYPRGARQPTTVWDSFFTAQVGASAALAGLTFVGLSINNTRILSIPRVPERGLETITILLTVLVVSSLVLVPGQPTVAIGLEVLATGAVSWTFNTWLGVGNLRKIDKKFRKYWVQDFVVSQAALLPFVAGGITTLAIGIDGIYWLVPAVVLSYLKAIVDAWVLLIEVNR